MQVMTCVQNHLGLWLGAQGHSHTNFAAVSGSLARTTVVLGLSTH